MAEEWEQAGLDARQVGAVPPMCPVELERRVSTRAGEVVLLRPIRPEDAPLLVEFHAALSPRSIYMRFFSFHPELTAREVERFTCVDYVDRLALVVEVEGHLVAVGRYERIAGSDDAEVAFVVNDGYQHQGLATLLADELARAARAQGIRAFVAETLAENAEMLEVFYGIGLPVHSCFHDGVVKLRFPIEPTRAYVEALGRREAQRAVAAGAVKAQPGC